MKEDSNESFTNLMEQACSQVEGLEGDPHNLIYSTEDKRVVGLNSEEEIMQEQPM
jgi:hypothetical protein